jgi:hypothetical protein
VAAARVSRARANPSLGREVGLWLLLAEDARIALLLLNRARYYVLSEMFGVGPAQANLVTFAALLGLADAAQRRTAWLRAPGTPTKVDLAIGAAAATTALAALAGPSRGGQRDEMLVAFAILHRLTAPAGVALRGAARAPWRLRRTIASQAERLASATSARS